MIYQSSSGPVEISTMALSHAKNARNKLQRTEPERAAEIEALSAHVEALEAAALTAAPREAEIGDNGGPALDEPASEVKGREAIDIHVEDLLLEAGNWADGIALETQGQADALGNLRGRLQQAVNLVNANAAEEKRPHNDAIAEIGEWQNGYVAKGLKRTPDGKLTKALLATGNLLSAWLIKQDEERRAREAEVAAAAAKAAAEALAAREEAKVATDLEVMDRAEDKIAEAKALLKQAEGVAKEKVKAGGGEGTRAQTLRTSYVADPPVDQAGWTAALKHYLSVEPDEIKRLLKRLADIDVRDPGKRARGIPGFSIREVKGV